MVRLRIILIKKKIIKRTKLHSYCFINESLVTPRNRCTKKLMLSRLYLLKYYLMRHLKVCLNEQFYILCLFIHNVNIPININNRLVLKADKMYCVNINFI